MPVKEPRPRSAAEDADTRRRLLEVAGSTFAERGFRRTTIREISRRAKVNVAAVNYHFGSKEELYVAALRGALEHIRGMPPRPDPPIDGDDLPRFLEFFVRNLVERVLSPRPDWQPKLLRRELEEPTFALDVVMKEHFRPTFKYLRDCIAPLLKGKSDREIDLHALSIIGQVVYYRCAGPIALRLLGAKEDEDLVQEIAAHVTRFSIRALGGGP